MNQIMEQKATSHTDRISKSSLLDRTTNDSGIKQKCFESERTSTLPVSLIVKQKDGIQDSFKYMQLMGERYILNKGIILFFSHATVVISGRQLGLLFQELTKHKVTSISLFDVDFPRDMIAHDKLEKDVAIVENITVEYKDKDIESYLTQLDTQTFTRNGHANDEQKGES